MRLITARTAHAGCGRGGPSLPGIAAAAVARGRAVLTTGESCPPAACRWLGRDRHGVVAASRACCLMGCLLPEWVGVERGFPLGSVRVPPSPQRGTSILSCLRAQCGTHLHTPSTGLSPHSTQYMSHSVVGAVDRLRRLRTGARGTHGVIWGRTGFSSGRGPRTARLVHSHFVGVAGSPQPISDATGGPNQ